LDTSTPIDYQQLLMDLYVYRLRSISFVELVERFEAALHIEPPSVVEEKAPTEYDSAKIKSNLVVVPVF